MLKGKSIGNGIVERAIIFATQAHSGQIRKLGEREEKMPYVVHPIEVGNYLLKKNQDIKYIIAGYLHDVCEDTQKTNQEIEEEFGKDVLEILLKWSEDKNKTWESRKYDTSEKLKRASQEETIFIFADKLNNLEDMYLQKYKLKTLDWGVFHRPKEMQKWYYTLLLERFKTRIKSEEFLRDLRYFEKMYNYVFFEE